MAIITGTNGDDKYRRLELGTNLADEIYGLAGNDSLVGFDGDDLLEGGRRRRRAVRRLRVRLCELPRLGRGRLRLPQLGLWRRRRRQGRPLYSIEGVIGSAYADHLVGNDQRNVLRGEGGADGLSAAAATTCSTAVAATTVWTAAPATTSCAAAPAPTPPTSATPRRRSWSISPAGTGFGGDAEATACSASRTSRHALRRPARRQRRGQRAAPALRRGCADRARRRRPVRLQPDQTTARPDGAGPHPRLQPGAGRQDRPRDHRRQRAGERQPGVHVHRPGASSPAPGQLRFFQQNGDTIVEANTTDRDRRRGDEDRARPAGLAAGQRLPPVASLVQTADLGRLGRPPHRFIGTIAGASCEHAKEQSSQYFGAGNQVTAPALRTTSA